MDVSYVMTVSRNGQVSIPAETRARWNAHTVVVVDMGDHVVIRPALDDPVRELRGVLAGRGPSTEDIRREERAAEARHETRRGG